MAEKAKKALKFAFGAAAGVAAGAGMYFAGKRAGIDEVRTTSSVTGSAAAVTAKLVSAAPAPDDGGVHVGAGQGNSSNVSTGSHEARGAGGTDGTSGADAVPRPAMKVPAKDVAQVARDRNAYHALINDRARDLRARIAEQAYASILSDEVATATQVEAAGVEVLEDELPGQGPGPSAADPKPVTDGPAASDAQNPGSFSTEPQPYERIQTAIKTSKLFSGEGDQAYKPTPFTMPGK